MRRAYTHPDAAPTSDPHNDYACKDNTISYYFQIFSRNNTNPYTQYDQAEGLPAHSAKLGKRASPHAKTKICMINFFYIPSKVIRVTTAYLCKH